MKNQNGFVAEDLAGAVILVALMIVSAGGIIGYCMNIGKVWGDTGYHFALRVVGIFIPFVGAIIGWF
jgi:hypothetical protein